MQHHQKGSLLLALIALLMGGATTFGIAWYRYARAAPPSEREITDAFHVLYHNVWWNRTVKNTRWLGVPVMQCPLDLWVIQEIIHETRPDVLIETGTHRGGGAYYYASVFDLLSGGRVYTVDIVDYPDKPRHPRIHYLTGSSTSEAVVRSIRESIKPPERVMVVLDSNHNKEHVLEELRLYSPLVTPGNYLVVQDTHLNGHPVFVGDTPDPGHQGPMEALEEYLPRNTQFQSDLSREKYGLTFCPRGWLKRMR